MLLQRTLNHTDPLRQRRCLVEHPLMRAMKGHRQGPQTYLKAGGCTLSDSGSTAFYVCVDQWYLRICSQISCARHGGWQTASTDLLRLSGAARRAFQDHH